MKRVDPDALEALAGYLSDRPEEALSIGELARALGVDYGTARRRLQAYARAKGLVLESERGRVGTRGPLSWRWFLRSPAAGPVDASRVKTQKVKAVAPRGRVQRVPAGTRPGREQVSTRRVRALGQEMAPAEDVALGLPPVVLKALTGDELLALRVLAKHGAARTTELAAHVGRPIDRVGGMMRALRRKLFGLGVTAFVDEPLADGEVLFRFVPKGKR